VAESRIVNISGLTITGAMGPKFYGLVVTDQRSIFVNLLSSKAMMGGILGGAVGATIGHAMSKERYIDYENADLETLARDEKNIVVPHMMVENLQVKKSMGTYQLKMKYMRRDGKVKKVQAVLATTRKEAKMAGMTFKDFSEARGRQLTNAYQKALPLSILMKSNLNP